MFAPAASKIAVRPGYDKTKHSLKKRKDSAQKENYLASTNEDETGRLDIYRYIDTNKSVTRIQTPDTTQKQDSNNKPQNETVFKKSLLPLALAPLVVFGTMALVTGAYKKSLGINKELKKLGEQGLTPIARQVMVNDDQQMAAYMLVENPNIKTFVGAMGVLTGAAFTFVSKNFIEGMKDIWVNREYARIKKHQQKELIDIETRSFEQRYDSLYSLMANTKQELDKIDRERAQNQPEPQEEAGLSFSFNPKANHKLNKIMKKLSFGSNNPQEKGTETKADKSGIKWSDVGFLALGAGVLAGSFLLARRSVKNFDSIIKKLSEPIKVMDNGIQREQHVFAQANSMWGAAEGTAPTSVVKEETAWLHTWIMALGTNTEKLAGTLFGLFSTMGALTFLGKTTVEAVKDVKVKEENTETDLQLHRELVDIEVQNYESKKKKFIDPLLKGYKNFLKTSPTDEEKSSMRQNIISKVENGPPYIWE